MKARLRCAWCGKDLGETETYDGSDSHGICKKCAAKMMAQAGLSVEDEDTDKEEGHGA